jgi:hypothetical protein
MTNPPQGSDEQDRGAQGREEPGPDQRLTQPVPSFERTQPATPPAQPYGHPAPQYGQQPPQAAPGGPYGQPGQSYGPPAPGYGQPTQPAYAQPGQYGATGYAQPPQYGPPQYGAAGQQYGGPAGTPGEKSKVGLIAIVTGIVLLVIAGAVVLVMSLQSTVLDPAAVERDVAAQFEQREGVAVELNCADTMEVSANASYECSGTTSDGEAVTLQIAVTDENSAAYTWSEP